MDIASVLSQAWKIMWKHKVLWIFGIFAGCSSLGPRDNSRFTYEEQITPQIQAYINQVPDWLWILIAIITVLVILALIALVVFLTTIGRIGMIHGSRKVDQGAAKLTFGELVREGIPYFWRLFLLGLAVGLAIFAVVILLALPFIGLAALTQAWILLAICLLPLVCLLIPLGLFVGLWVEQASIAIVVENLGIVEALRRAWQVISTNVATYIVMWLILVFGFAFIGGLIITLPLFALLVPVLVALFMATEQAFQTGMILAMIGLLIYLPILILLNGILRGYILTAWTLTYLRLTGRAALPIPVE